MRLAALTLLLALAGPAGAARLEARSLKTAKTASGFLQGSGAEVFASASPRECVRDAKCWSFVKTIFLKNFDLNREKVDAALPGQFFPDAQTFSLRAAIKGSGHYLWVLCGKGRSRRPCEDKQARLEKRVFEAAVALSLPGAARPEQRADLDTLVLLPPGKQLISQAQDARPGMMEELLDAAISSLGVEDDPVPRALR